MSELTGRPDDPHARRVDHQPPPDPPRPPDTGDDDPTGGQSDDRHDEHEPEAFTATADPETAAGHDIWYVPVADPPDTPDGDEPVWSDLPALTAEPVEPAADTGPVFTLPPDQPLAVDIPWFIDSPTHDPGGADSDLPTVDAVAHVPRQAAGDAPPGDPNSDATRQSDAVAQPPVFGPDDLTATGRTPPRDTRELMTGPDGRDHFVGDSHGTFRDSVGDLQRSTGGYVRDHNRPTDVIEEDPGDNLTVLPEPDDPAAAPFFDGADDNVDAATAKEIIRKTKIDPLLDRMTDAGLDATTKVFASSDVKYKEFRRDAADVMTDADLVEIDTVRDEYRDADKRLRASSERLGQLAGDYITAKMFPDAIVVTGGKNETGRSAELDRVLFIPGDNPKMIVIEEKGATSKLSTREVANPVDPTGPRIIARQCSPEYVRDVLHIDATLAKAIRADPALGRALQQTVTGANSGELQCYLVNGQSNGKIKVTRMLLAPLRLLRESIRLAGHEPEGDQR